MTVQRISRSLMASALVVGSFLLTSIVSSDASAGVWEIGASGSYRRQNIDVDAVDEAQSLTGSLSYYFNEASALELSYTDGKSRREIESTSGGNTIVHRTTVNYQAIGLDFIYTIGTREAQVRPYIKAGLQYMLTKEYIDQFIQNGNPYQSTGSNENDSLVPTVGAGVRIGLTEALSLKAGIDAWSSRALNKKPFDVDYAARVGLGWMF